MKPSYNGEYKIETQSVEINVQKWSREKETIDVRGLLRLYEKDETNSQKNIIPDDYKIPKNLLNKLKGNLIYMRLEDIEKEGYSSVLVKELKLNLRHIIFDWTQVTDDDECCYDIYLPKLKPNGTKYSEIEKTHLIEEKLGKKIYPKGW